jgi:hypothetical protein
VRPIFAARPTGQKKGIHTPTVGTLTVDLVANTASFSGDLGEASNDAEQFGKSVSQAGEQVDFSMREARGSLMLVGDEIGVHIPRHLQALIAEIPGVGMAFAEMLPLVGVLAAIALIAKLIEKSAEAKEKLAEGMEKFGITSADVLNSLDDKLLQVSIRADELAGNHLQALREQLLLIDRTSLKELATEFNKLAEVADQVFGSLKTHWFEMHVGSEGAQHALNQFKGDYELLLAQGKKSEASDLLKGTLESAQASLKAMQSASFVSKGLGEVSAESVKSQKALIATLETQLQVQSKIEAIGSGEKQNAKTEEAQGEAARQEELYKVQQAGLSKRFEAEKRFREEKLKLAKAATKEEAQLEHEQYEATLSVQMESEKTARALQGESLKQTEAMAKIADATREESARHELAMRRVTAQSAADIESASIQERLKTQLDGLNAEESLLDKNKDVVKIQEIEDKKTQIIAEAANEQTKIRDQAAQKQYADITKAENQMTDAVVKTAAKSIMEGKNMAQAFAQMGQQMAESALENALKMILTGDMQKLADAKLAAANAYAAASSIPLVGPALAPAAAATAFASVMAFEKGGEIPGSGAVPIIAHGGETVVTKALTDQVRNNTGTKPHVLNYAPSITAIDSDGVKGMLQEHAAEFQDHFEGSIRRMNQ